MNRRQWFASLFATPAASTAIAAQKGGGGWFRTRRPQCSLREIERGLIIRALREFNGDRTKAARYLDVSRRSLAYKMEQYGIRA